jgi:hypothetical protein
MQGIISSRPIGTRFQEAKPAVAVFLVAFTVALALFPASSHAAAVSGVLDFAGSVSFDSDDMDFLPAGGGTGSFDVLGTSTGSFAALGGTGGTIKDLNAAFAPVGVAFLLTDFVTFSANANLTADLNFILPGNFSSAQCGAVPAAGQTCTPFLGSPFNLTNLTADSSLLTFDVAGTFEDSTTPGPAPYIGTFTAQFASPYQSLLATVLSGGSVQTSYSAQFNEFDAGAVPEPGSLVLLGFGLAGLAIARRRNARK